MTIVLPEHWLITLDNIPEEEALSGARAQKHTADTARRMLLLLLSDKVISTMDYIAIYPAADGGVQLEWDNGETFWLVQILNNHTAMVHSCRDNNDQYGETITDAEGEELARAIAAIIAS